MTKFDEAPDVLTVKQVSELLNICEPGIYTLIHRADFPSFRVGRCVRIGKEALRKWVNQQTGWSEQEGP